jgi:hypothetical protein
MDNITAVLVPFPPARPDTTPEPHTATVPA